MERDKETSDDHADHHGSIGTQVRSVSMDINKALFSFIKIAFLVMVILLVVYATIHLSKTGYEYGYRLYTETAVDEEPGEDVLVQVKPDMSNRQIAQMLQEKGLVRDSKLFYLQLKLSAYSHSIEPGVYTLNTSMTPKELMIAMSPEESTESTGSTEGADTTEIVTTEE